MKQTYIVSGHPRTGTSMMMKALRAGGLEAVWSPVRDKMRTWFGDEDYDPNEGGMYELTVQQMQQPGFPRMYEGKLIKALYGAAVHLVAGDYLVVYMRRPWSEVKPSYDGFMGTDFGFRYVAATSSREVYDALMEDYLGILRQRADMTVTELWYGDVLRSPIQTFERLAEVGWPVDVGACAAVVQPELQRCVS